MELFDYWTTWIIMVFVFYYFMIAPFLEDTKVKCSYRDDCQMAQFLWVVLALSGLYYIGF